MLKTIFEFVCGVYLGIVLATPLLWFMLIFVVKRLYARIDNLEYLLAQRGNENEKEIG